MKILNEFRTFAIKGNVIDMAIGIIIGTAFGKIITSLVNDIILPPLGLLVGGINFSDLNIIIKEANKTNTAISINYGNFIQVTFDFLLVALSIFMVIKVINSAKRKKEEIEAANTIIPNSKTETLLTEIRDLLKK